MLPRHKPGMPLSSTCFPRHGPAAPDSDRPDHTSELRGFLLHGVLLPAQAENVLLKAVPAAPINSSDTGHTSAGRSPSGPKFIAKVADFGEPCTAPAWLLAGTHLWPLTSTNSGAVRLQCHALL